MNIIEAMEDPHLFGPIFRRYPDGTDPWAAWRSFLKILFGLDMNEADHDRLREFADRELAPEEGAKEAWLVIGRRGGKSQILALIAVYLAAFRDWAQHLAPGEVATIMVLAADRRQARSIFRYVSGLIESVDLLNKLVAKHTAEAIELTNRVHIEIHTASFRRVRGYTVAAALLDEVAFWWGEDTQNPDTEIVAALRPAMATVPGAMLLAASSPYAQRGELWNQYRNHFGDDNSNILVWKAPTTAMNPTVPQSVIDEAMERDPDHAQAEYYAEFREDIADFLSRAAIDAVVEPGCFELPYESANNYLGFVDPSGGSRDSMTLGIAHWKKDEAVLDCVREVRPPFSPDAVTKQFADTLKSYHLNTVTGDRYGGEWPRERFRKHGIFYRPSEQVKNEIYSNLLPLVNARRCRLLDHPRMLSQLSGLERRTARSGKDSIDHRVGAHDDVANAAAGALTLAARRAERGGFRVLHVKA